MTKLTEQQAIDALADVSDALNGAEVSCISRGIDVSIKEDGQVIVSRWDDVHETAINECPGQRGGLEDR